MLEQTKRLSFIISSILSKVEPEPDLHNGSGSATLPAGIAQKLWKELKFKNNVKQDLVLLLLLFSYIMFGRQFSEWNQ